MKNKITGTCCLLVLNFSTSFFNSGLVITSILLQYERTAAARFASAGPRILSLSASAALSASVRDISAGLSLGKAARKERMQEIRFLTEEVE